SREAGAKFPPRWITPIALTALKNEFENARQAEIRAHHVDQELDKGVWETDATVLDRHVRMTQQVRDEEEQLSNRKASNALAATAAGNARERYI
ncbi:hypothetical protein ABTL19_19225, partial [Acinetobacter baumannii]